MSPSQGQGVPFRDQKFLVLLTLEFPEPDTRITRDDIKQFIAEHLEHGDLKGSDPSVMINSVMER